MTPLQVATPDDARGMQALLRLMGRDPVPAAALLLVAVKRRVVVATGFPVDGAPETDGPPGAIVLARALAALHGPGAVAIASWGAVLDLVSPELPPGVALEDVPLPPAPVRRIEGAAVVVECCGTTREGARLDMRGRDLASVAPCFEDALGDEVLVAVGDGGNEVGMGSAPAGWHEERGLQRPRSTAVALVPCGVSNWGALAIVATLQALTGVPLLPSPDDHLAMLERLVGRGAVDGFTGRREPFVDGRPAAEEAEVVARLARMVSSA